MSERTILWADAAFGSADRTTMPRLLEGLECACEMASTCEAALARLLDAHCDLLIADLGLPGNERLEFIAEVSRILPRLPVIVTTAQPSIDSAVRSFDFPIVAYLVKPLDAEALRGRVRGAIRATRENLVVAKTKALLRECLADLEASTAGPPRQQWQIAAKISPATLRTLAWCASELAARGGADVQEQCRCDRSHSLAPEPHAVLRDAVQETVRVLLRTKSAFKSKELAQLRSRLECVLDDTKEALSLH